MLNILQFVPSGKKLKQFQLKGVEIIVLALSKNKVFMLADEMGLGKTIQAITVLNFLRPQKILIVCPACLVTNWQVELKAWTYKQFQSIEVISYNHMVGNSKHFLKREYDFIVFDEAHYLKNPVSKRTTIGYKLNAKKILMLTGTPVLNKPIELWPFLRAADRGGLGKSWYRFVTEFCDGKIDRDTGYWDVSGFSNLSVLKQYLVHQSLLLRRTKREVMSELGDKTRQIVHVQASAVPISSIDIHNIASARRADALTKVTKSVEYLKLLLETHKKIIVFAHHRDVLELTQKHFDKNSVLVYGGIANKRRWELINQFTDNKHCRLFFGSITAAGTGINLTCASTVVFLELDWVPAIMAQAEDRCHRIGQKSPVNIQYLITPCSFDSFLIKVILKKLRINEDLFDTIDGASILKHA